MRGWEGMPLIQLQCASFYLTNHLTLIISVPRSNTSDSTSDTGLVPFPVPVVIPFQWKIKALPWLAFLFWLLLAPPFHCGHSPPMKTQQWTQNQSTLWHNDSYARYFRVHLRKVELNSAHKTNPHCKKTFLYILTGVILSQCSNLNL